MRHEFGKRSTRPFKYSLPGNFDVGIDADTVKEQGELHGVPLMMLANKQDLPEAIPTADISVQFDMHKIKKVAFRLQPCSGLTW